LLENKVKLDERFDKKKVKSDERMKRKVKLDEQFAKMKMILNERCAIT